MPAAGNRHRRVVSAKTQAEVRRRLGELRAELDRGLAPVRTDTVAAFLAGWIERERQRVRPATWRGRELHVRGYLIPALEIYHRTFQPSRQLDRPYTMAGVNVVAAETDAEARRLFTSVQQQFANLFRGTPSRLAPPIDDIDGYWTPTEKAHASSMLAVSFVGSGESVRRELGQFITRTAVDEVIVSSAIYDHRARLRSYEILADVMNAEAGAAATPHGAASLDT